LQNETAKGAKRAKFFKFFGNLRGLSGSNLLSDITLRRLRTLELFLFAQGGQTDCTVNR
jgi:hypothetical protein